MNMVMLATNLHQLAATQEKDAGTNAIFCELMLQCITQLILMEKK